jgi:hypothetical protein
MPNTQERMINLTQWDYSKFRFNSNSIKNMEDARRDSACRPVRALWRATPNREQRRQQRFVLGAHRRRQRILEKRLAFDEQVAVMREKNSAKCQGAIQ